MAVNINTLQPDNCTLALIDHQPWVAFPIESHVRAQIVNNVVGLAKVAKALAIPTVLTTISATSGPLADPLFGELRDVHPDVEPIDRSNTNAWSDPRFVEAIGASGRRRLVMAGLWTEVCLAQTVISALAAGYEVFFVSDASGGLSREAHEDAKQRMIQAGAVPMTWLAVLAEWTPDNSTPEYQVNYPTIIEHGGALGGAVEYIAAQLSRAEPVGAGAPS